MRFRGGEFSTGTMGNFQPELTATLSRRNESLPDGGYGRGGDVPWQMSRNQDQ